MKIKMLSLLLVLFTAASCTGKTGPADPNPTPHDVSKGPGVFSKDNGNILSFFKGKSLSGESAKLGVNSYIWRASLQAISFMPLTQADSAGGVILSDWIDQENAKNKQVKVNVYILSKKLEPTALNVKVFTREKLTDNAYSAVKEDLTTATALEETILSKARTLKIKDQASD
ncbi:MAG: DUF3576 domain-containing protein [Proteobacteria bacterium]|nr:DUF3576 domain-containing protein [Pseudomonadota bacterium]